MDAVRRDFILWLLIYPVYFVLFSFTHELSHAVAALAYGDSVIIGLNNTLLRDPQAGHFTLAFHLAGPIATISLSSLGLFMYIRKPSTAPNLFSSMCIVNAVNRIGPILAYYGGILGRQDELYAGLFLVNGKMVMNYDEALDAYMQASDFYFNNPLYHVFAATSLILLSIILYIFAKNARKPFVSHRRLTIISVILITIVSATLIRGIDPFVRIHLNPIS